MYKTIPTRKNYELPECLENWGWRYHHLGIPTKKKMPEEKYQPQLGAYVSGFKTNPFGIEWIRFKIDSPTDILIQNVPHLSFEVDDIEYELSVHNLNIITKPIYLSSKIRVAMFEHNGAPIELIQFKKCDKLDAITKEHLLYDVSW